MAFALMASSLTIGQPQTAEAASKKTTVNKNRIEFVTTETMKGKDYTEENMLLNRTTAVTTYKRKKITLVPVYIYQNGKLMGSGKNCVSYKTLKYKSSKPSVASVNKKGVITPKKNGTATITVSSVYNSKVKGTIEVTVTTKVKAVKATKKESKKAKFVLEASHQKTCDTAWMYPGEYMTLSMKYSKNMKNKKLKWKSSDKSIATVNKNGVVTTKKKGSVTITATSTADKSVKATFEIEVKRIPTAEENAK
ncbi:MAG: Ig-like domain-containing protein, partial [Roseburia sp.]|nr:Ig-like domain-containing protein [Roseburia sp.]